MADLPGSAAGCRREDRSIGPSSISGSRCSGLLVLKAGAIVLSCKSVPTAACLRQASRSAHWPRLSLSPLPNPVRCRRPRCRCPDRSRRISFHIHGYAQHRDPARGRTYRHRPRPHRSDRRRGIRRLSRQAGPVAPPNQLCCVGLRPSPALILLRTAGNS